MKKVYVIRFPQSDEYTLIRSRIGVKYLITKKHAKLVYIETCKSSARYMLKVTYTHKRISNIVTLIDMCTIVQVEYFFMQYMGRDGYKVHIKAL